MKRFFRIFLSIFLFLMLTAGPIGAANTGPEVVNRQAALVQLAQIASTIAVPPLSKAALNELILALLHDLQMQPGASGLGSLDEDQSELLTETLAALFGLASPDRLLEPEGVTLGTNAIRLGFLLSLETRDPARIGAAFSKLVAGMSVDSLANNLAEVPQSFSEHLPLNLQLEASDLSLFVASLEGPRLETEAKGAAFDFMLQNVLPAVPEQDPVLQQFAPIFKRALAAEQGDWRLALRAAWALEKSILTEPDPLKRQLFIARWNISADLALTSSLGLREASAYAAFLLSEYAAGSQRGAFLPVALSGLATRVIDGTALFPSERMNFQRAVIGIVGSDADAAEVAKGTLDALLSLLQSMQPRMLENEELIAEIRRELAERFDFVTTVESRSDLSEPLPEDAGQATQIASPEPTPTPTSTPADECPEDPEKVAPGLCGCGLSDADTDGDGSPDLCGDACPNDVAKTAEGICGCGVSDENTDSDAVPDCLDACPHDAAKETPGACGCGISDGDTDGDSALDCSEECDSDPAKDVPARCGCGNVDAEDGWGELACVGAADGVGEGETEYQFSDIALLRGTVANNAARETAVASLSGKKIESLPHLRALGSALLTPQNPSEVKLEVLRVLSRSYFSLEISETGALHPYLRQLAMVAAESRDRAVLSLVRRELRRLLRIPNFPDLEAVVIRLLESFRLDPTPDSNPPSDSYRLFRLRLAAEVLTLAEQNLSKVGSYETMREIPAKIAMLADTLVAIAQGSDEITAEWSIVLLGIGAFDLDVEQPIANNFIDALASIAKDPAKNLERRELAIDRFNRAFFVRKPGYFQKRSDEQVGDLARRAAAQLNQVLDHGEDYTSRLSAGTPFQSLPGRSPRLMKKVVGILASSSKWHTGEYMSLVSAMLRLDPSAEIRGTLLDRSLPGLTAAFDTNPAIFGNARATGLIDAVASNLLDPSIEVSDGALGALWQASRSGDSPFSDLLAARHATLSGQVKDKLVGLTNDTGAPREKYLTQVGFIYHLRAAEKRSAENAASTDATLRPPPLVPYEQELYRDLLAPEPLMIPSLSRQLLVVEFFLKLGIGGGDFHRSVIAAFTARALENPATVSFPRALFAEVDLGDIAYESASTLDVGNAEQRTAKLVTLNHILDYSDASDTPQFRSAIGNAVRNAAYDIDLLSVPQLLKKPPPSWWLEAAV